MVRAERTIAERAQTRAERSARRGVRRAVVARELSLTPKKFRARDEIVAEARAARDAVVDIGRRKITREVGTTDLGYWRWTQLTGTDFDLLRSRPDQYTDSSASGTIDGKEVKGAEAARIHANYNQGLNAIQYEHDGITYAENRRAERKKTRRKVREGIQHAVKETPRYLANVFGITTGKEAQQLYPERFGTNETINKLKRAGYGVRQLLFPFTSQYLFELRRQQIQKTDGEQKLVVAGSIVADMAATLLLPHVPLGVAAKLSTNVLSRWTAHEYGDMTT